LLEKVFYKYPSRYHGGILLLVTTTSFVTFLTYIILSLAHNNLIYLLINTLIIYFAISIKSMTHHAEKVYQPLSEGDIETARAELSMIVSRDTINMESDMVVRSTVESVSENFTDAVLSPMFYSVLFGGVGAMFFKSVSTLDSMVGYMNDRYELFGRSSARFDDVLNFVPARLSVLVIAIAGAVYGSSFQKTMATAKKFRLAHPSPNSAHSMSAFAGVLGITLGGSVSYFGKLKDKPYIGDGANVLTANVIKEAVELYKLSALVSLIMLVCIPLLRIAF